MRGIEEEFRPLGIVKGGILMLQPSDAIKMVQKCRERNIRVLGIDGFILTEGRTTPTMENSADFSSGRNQSNTLSSWDRALAFLEARKETNLVFEVVTGSSL